MKSTGIVRRVDELGRVVLPKELRRTLGIDNGDPMEIFMDGDKIVLRKYVPGCMFTGEDKDLISFRGKLISKSTIREMVRAAGI